MRFPALSIRTMREFTNDKRYEKIMKAEFPSSVTFLKLVSGIGMVIMLTDGSLTAVLAGDIVSNNLLASQIVEKSREAYASLSSYSDEGRIVAGIGGGSITTTFSIRLARPNFYQIEWVQNSDSPFSSQQTSIQAAWSSGAGDFLDTGWATQKQYNREIALLNAASFSGGAAATIPMTFFHIESGDAVRDSGFSANRQADQIAAGEDCYVITWKSQGRTKTLWIGKRDFLIRQVRTIVSAEAMRAAIVKWDPEIMSALRGFTSIETHTNIVVNKQFSQADFAPSFPTSPPIDNE